MKHSIAGAAAAAIILATALTALADGQYDRGRPQFHGPPPRRVVYVHRYYQGQIWNGHRLFYHGGRWGYYRPHNGVRLFINVPL